MNAASTFTIDATGKMREDGLISQCIFNDELLDYGALSKIAGVEFEKPVSVDVMRYISRNDKNGVVSGRYLRVAVF